MDDGNVSALVRVHAVLLARVEAVEQENAAYSYLFSALTGSLGLEFLDHAAMALEYAETRADPGSLHGRKMTGALKIIEQIREVAKNHPKNMK